MHFSPHHAPAGALGRFRHHGRPVWLCPLHDPRLGTPLCTVQLLCGYAHEHTLASPVTAPDTVSAPHGVRALRGWVGGSTVGSGATNESTDSTNGGSTGMCDTILMAEVCWYVPLHIVPVLCPCGSAARAGAPAAPLPIAILITVQRVL